MDEKMHTIQTTIEWYGPNICPDTHLSQVIVIIDGGNYTSHWDGDNKEFLSPFGGPLTKPIELWAFRPRSPYDKSMKDKVKYCEEGCRKNG